jgi:glutathione synthase/RimK-type ligase-like ATP-grasp enzyme
MRIAVLTSHPVLSAGSVMAQSLELLRSWGVEVEVVLPDRLVDLAAPAPQADLYLLKSVSEPVLSIAAAVEAAGGRCCNTAAVVRLCRDRIAATAALAAAGVPVPRSWSTSRPDALAPLLAEGPLVLKAARAGDPAGSRIVWDVDGLLEMTSMEQVWLAQRLAARPGRERKVYRIADQVFGVQRRWPARTSTGSIGEPFTVSGGLRDITDRVAAALGTDLFGIDVVPGDAGPVVVDVHPFPGCTGVPNAHLRLADHLYAVASGLPHPGPQHLSTQQQTAGKAVTS